MRRNEPRYSQWGKAVFGARMLIRLVLPAVAFAAGCGRDAAAPGQAEGPRVADADALVAEAAAALKVAGIPEAPLGASATRAQREEYLLGTEKTLSALKRLASAPQGSRQVQPCLLPASKTDEVEKLSRVLAVELADAVDRSDPARAEAAIRAAVRYADLLSELSLSSAVAAGGVADALALGLKSVGPQLDAEMAERVSAVLNELSSRSPDFAAARRAELERLDAWRKELAKSAEPVTVSQLLLSAGGDTQGRSNLSPELEEAISALAARHSKGGDSLPAKLVAKEADVALRAVSAFLRGPAPDFDWPPTREHPVATLYLGLLRPSLDAAPRLAQLRLESLRFVTLTTRVLAAGLPDSLKAFGDEAISPVSGLPFEYKRTRSGFELSRPRRPAPPA